MTQAKGNPESSFSDENLRLVVADLFSAGMVTTSTTLAWALLLMILHPDVQRESSPGWVVGGGQPEASELGWFGHQRQLCAGAEPQLRCHSASSEWTQCCPGIRRRREPSPWV